MKIIIGVALAVVMVLFGYYTYQMFWLKPPLFQGKAKPPTTIYFPVPASNEPKAGQVLEMNSHGNRTWVDLPPASPLRDPEKFMHTQKVSGNCPEWAHDGREVIEWVKCSPRTGNAYTRSPSSPAVTGGGNVIIYEDGKEKKP